MSHRSYVLHWIHSNSFQKIKSFRTKEKHVNLSRPSHSDSTFTKIQLKSNPSIHSFHIADLTHRYALNVNGLWNGQYVPNVIKECSFFSFYNMKEKLFISNVGKSVAYSAVKNLNDSKYENLSFKKVNVDLPKLIGLSRNLTQIWFGIKNDKYVKQLALYGTHIRRSGYYSSLNIQSIKAVTVEIKVLRRSVKARVSKDGSIYFFEDYDLSRCLEFVRYLKKKDVF